MRKVCISFFLIKGMNAMKSLDIDADICYYKTQHTFQQMPYQGA